MHWNPFEKKEPAPFRWKKANSFTGPGKELTGAFGAIEFLLRDAAALIFSISVGTRTAVAAAGRRVLRLPVPSGRRAALRHG